MGERAYFIRQLGHAQREAVLLDGVAGAGEAQTGVGVEGEVGGAEAGAGGEEVGGALFHCGGEAMLGGMCLYLISGGGRVVR